MKIAVFGDSFADKSGNLSNNTETWYEILGLRNSVDNYGKSGSNLFFSYTNFIENHDRYDKIIFVVTDYGRLMLDEEFYKKIDFFDIFIANINQAKYKQQQYINDKNISSIFELASNYFLYLQNHKSDKLFHRLMIESIKQTRPNDCLLLPISPYSLVDSNFYLNHVFFKENAHWNLDIKDILTNCVYIDKRNCHMSMENNKILADKIQDYLDSGIIHLDASDFILPDNKDFYIEKINR